MNIYEIISFVLYFIVVLGVGIFFFFKTKVSNEKDYFLGGKNMGGLVAAFSAGASDMSAWVLMGLPGSICLYGLGEVWISIGLFLGTVLAWIFVAPKLRRFANKAGDAVTVPEFLANRFLAKNAVLRVACAVIFVIGYCIYGASSISACGDLFNQVMGLDKNVSMIIAAVIILIYTLLGGFNAVCWTDFFQGLLMLLALMTVPIVALFVLNSVGGGPIAEYSSVIPSFTGNLFNCADTTWGSISKIITGLGWGLGYFGMPHILVRYMSVKNEKEMRKSQIIGISWIFVILVMATVVGLVGHNYFGDYITSDNKSTMFIELVRSLFGYGALALISGIMLSAIVAASMSTADSQLLLSSSAFSSDIYKVAIRKKASQKEVLWVGRISVALILVIALLIALFGSQDIMQLVSAAWSIFGAAFGPAIILALFWKRFNYKGCVSGIITGFVVSILWLVFFNFEYYGTSANPYVSVIANTGIYEIVPGFIVGMLVAVVVTLLTKKPSAEEEALFDSVKKDEE